MGSLADYIYVSGILLFVPSNDEAKQCETSSMFPVFPVRTELVKSGPARRGTEPNKIELAESWMVRTIVERTFDFGKRAVARPPKRVMVKVLKRCVNHACAHSVLSCTPWRPSRTS